MNISDGEKLILVMLSDIYAHLKINGEVDPDFVKSALFDDKAWGLKWQYPGLFSEQGNEAPPAVVETVDILSMWRHIEFSYKKLSTQDKERIKVGAHPFGQDVSFDGFDGNEETEHVGIAQFIVEKLDRFQEFKGRDFNSHTENLGRSRRMLAVYKPMLTATGPDYLTPEQLIAILKERKHPS